MTSVITNASGADCGVESGLSGGGAGNAGCSEGYLDVDNLTQAQYNALIQEVQGFPWETRVRPYYSTTAATPGALPRLLQATFEVFYGGWHVVGRQSDPMTGRDRYSWDEEKQYRLMAELGRDLTQ